jgi:hypothetical protein
MYKIFYLKGNPNFEYRFKGGSWEKRPIASSEKFYKVNSNGQGVLNESHKPKKGLKPFWYLSNTTKIGVAVGVVAIGLYLYKGRLKTKINELR